MNSIERHKLIHPASFRPQDWLRFILIDPFPGQWSRLKLTEEHMQLLEIFVMTNPLIGAVVSQTGGLRKCRFRIPKSGKGKSGSYRLFYVYFPECSHLVLWAVLGKGQSENLAEAQRNEIAKQIARLKSLLDKGVIR